MTAAYELVNVGFSYDETPVLNVDALRVESGEILGLLGPNGSGKTTLLHVLAFVETPTRGTLRFFGENTEDGDVVELRRRVGLLLQNPYLFHTSVLGNVMWGLRIRGVSHEESRRKAMESLDIVKMTDYARRHARSLSGGEAQRVALARALVLDPDVLLLDEPANHMDRQSVARVEEAVARVNKEQGKTIIYSSHSGLRNEHLLPDRVLHLFRGKIVSYFGENLLYGRMDPEESVFITRRMRIQLPEDSPQGSYLTIDPSKIRVSLTPDNRSLTGRIVSLTEENRGVRVEIEAGERIHALLDRDVAPVNELHLGRTVGLDIPLSALRVL